MQNLFFIRYSGIHDNENDWIWLHYYCSLTPWSTEINKNKKLVIMLMTRLQLRQKCWFNLRAFGSSTLGLPVVVARAYGFVAVIARRDAEALGTAFLAEEHAWFVVLRLTTSSWALRWAFWLFHLQRYKHVRFFSCLTVWENSNKLLQHFIAMA